MKKASVFIIFLLIIIILLYPNAYDFYVKSKLLKVARTVSIDLMSSRSTGVISDENYVINFDIENNSYTVFIDTNNNEKLDMGEKTVMVFSLKEIEEDVIFNKDLNNSKFISFKKDKEGFSSLFFVYKKDYDKGIKDRVVMLQIDNKFYDTTIFISQKLKNNNELIFKKVI